MNNITLNFFRNTALIANDIYKLTSPRDCNINIGNLANIFHLSKDSDEAFLTNSIGVCKCDETGLANSLSNCSNETFENHNIVKENITKYPGEVHLLLLDMEVKILNIKLHPCPKGFQLVNGVPVCNCIEILQNTSSVVCDITTEEITVTRTGPVWYGTMNNHSCYITDTICGYDYCVDGTITFTLVNNSDMQCNSHRSGLLCSQCSKGKSLKLGSNECGNCNNSFVAMIILFFFAGIGLIGLIIMLNLTVLVGTVNGLIFYANILKMYEHIFFFQKVQFLLSISSYHGLTWILGSIFYTIHIFKGVGMICFFILYMESDSNHHNFVPLVNETVWITHCSCTSNTSTIIIHQIDAIHSICIEWAAYIYILQLRQQH